MQLEGRQEQRTSVKRLICRRKGGEGCVCWPFGSVDIYSARLLKRSGRRFTLDFGCTECVLRDASVRALGCWDAHAGTTVSLC